ncbi:MAG: hypothetical protein ACI3X9_09605, partial [Bacteroidaceae bacterium]
VRTFRDMAKTKRTFFAKKSHFREKRGRPRVRVIYYSIEDPYKNDLEVLGRRVLQPYSKEDIANKQRTHLSDSPQKHGNLLKIHFSKSILAKPHTPRAIFPTFRHTPPANSCKYGSKRAKKDRLLEIFRFFLGQLIKNGYFCSMNM